MKLIGLVFLNPLLINVNADDGGGDDYQQKDHHHLVKRMDLESCIGAPIFVRLYLNSIYFFYKLIVISGVIYVW